MADGDGGGDNHHRHSDNFHVNDKVHWRHGTKMMGSCAGRCFLVRQLAGISDESVDEVTRSRCLENLEMRFIELELCKRALLRKRLKTGKMQVRSTEISVFRLQTFRKALNLQVRSIANLLLTI